MSSSVDVEDGWLEDASFYTVTSHPSNSIVLSRNSFSANRGALTAHPPRRRNNYNCERRANCFFLLILFFCSVIYLCIYVSSTSVNNPRTLSDIPFERLVNPDPYQVSAARDQINTLDQRQQAWERGRETYLNSVGLIRKAPPTIWSATSTSHSTATDVRDFKLDVLGPLPLLSRLNDFPTASSGVPFYLHVPKSAGSTMKTVMTLCYKLVSASNVGARPDMVAVDPPKERGRLQLVQDAAGNKYVNIQTTALIGLQWAKENNFTSSGLADVVSSHLFMLSLEHLFSEEYKGNAFTILRHPVHRTLSIFLYRGSESSKHERNYDPSFKNLTLGDYLTGDKIEHNWLTRKLNGDLMGTISREHVDHAMEILRTKFLIGLMSQFEESLRRFAIYFQWKQDADSNQCISNILHRGGMNRNSDVNLSYRKKVLTPSSPEYAMVLKHNQHDMQLYHYAEQLFSEQGKYIYQRKYIY